GPGTNLSSVVLASDGTIVGGTIIDHGSGMTFSGGTLNGVTYDGTMNLSANPSSVHVANRLTPTRINGTRPGSINLTGLGDNIYFDGNQTFDNATINIGYLGSGTTGNPDSIYNDDTNNLGSVLTLGPNLTVNVNTSYVGNGNAVYLQSAGSNQAGD